MSDYIQVKITTGSESAKEKENHHKWNILVAIQVHYFYKHRFMDEKLFNLCLHCWPCVKELSCHASHDICRNQLKFSNYNLVYYMPIICQ